MKQKVTFLVVVMFLFAWIGCNKSSTTPTEPDGTMATATVTGTITQTFTITPTFTATHEPLIDDCEDNDNTDEWGGYWVTFDDQANAGTSYVWPWSDPYATSHGLTPMLFEMSAGGYNSSYAAHITGYTTSTYQYRFIGMGCQLTATAGSSGGCHDVDISNFTGISFWAKGDATNYIVMIPYTPSYPDMTCDSASLVAYADYGYKLTAVPTTWTQYTIAFTQFTQPSWGSIHPALTTVLQHAKQIQFKTDDPPSAHDAGVDFWVDDVTFY
ncbi:MAG: CIA30 family protein [Spirochaetia bacterium]|nr:CIA30 family protein [Spirochaetia bacterium]